MFDLKKISLLLVGNKEDEFIFKPFFHSITLVKSNTQILEFYRIERPSVILLNYDSNIDSNIIKEIRKIDKEVILILIVKDMNVRLLDILSLNVFGWLIKPFQKEKIEILLTNINNKVKLSFPAIKTLKNNYFFNLDSEKLYNELNEEIKLTKNEKYFLKIMLTEKESYISSESIEYLIWEEASLQKNCDGRLKSLLNGIRKKLPKKSIVNQYGIGYILERY